MTTLAIEISDAGILTVDDDSLGARLGHDGSAPEERSASPGYALYDDGTLLTGLDAVERARLKPRFVHHRFWHELDTTPLGRPFPRHLSRADLAHAHLAGVWSSVADGIESVLLAVPGCFSDQQLGLLLGIARACGMPVEGMVDAAVAAAAESSLKLKRGEGRPRCKLLHLDVHLHRMVLSVLRRNRELVRQRVEVRDEVGLVVLRDALARRIAELFVQATRFDPLHSAVAEQSLYCRLPEWLERLRQADSTVVELESSGKEHVIELTREAAVAAMDGFFAHVPELVRSVKRAGEPVTLLVSHRLAGLPGIEERLSELRDTERISLAPQAAAAGALRAKDVIRDRSPGKELAFVLRLPFEPIEPAADKNPTTRGEAAAVPVPGRSPTHLVHDGLAYPITSAPFVLGVAPPAGQPGLRLEGPAVGISRSHCSIYQQDGRVVVEDHSTYGSHLNGERVAGRAVLVAGDRLHLGSPGIEIELIAVVESDGTS